MSLDFLVFLRRPSQFQRQSDHGQIKNQTNWIVGQQRSVETAIQSNKNPHWEKSKTKNLNSIQTKRKWVCNDAY